MRKILAIEFPTKEKRHSENGKLQSAKGLEITGFEPVASYMRSKRSTTELYPHYVLRRHLMTNLILKFQGKALKDLGSMVFSI